VASLGAQTKPAYEIYAIRYATLKDFAVSGLVAGADKPRKNEFMRQWHPADYDKPSIATSTAPDSNPKASRM